MIIPESRLRDANLAQGGLDGSANVRRHSRPPSPTTNGTSPYRGILVLEVGLIPDTEGAKARQLLLELIEKTGGPLLVALPNAPEDDEPTSPEEDEGAAEAWQQYLQGKGRALGRSSQRVVRSVSRWEV